MLAAIALRCRGGVWLIGLAGLGALVLHAQWIDWPVLTTNMQRGLTGFAAGALCWELFRRRSNTPLAAATLLEALSLGALFGFIWCSEQTLHFEWIFLPAAAVVFVFAHQGGAISRLLMARWPMWLGAISYSLYMVHVMVLARAADLILLASRLTGHSLASYGYLGEVPIKSIDLPLLPALLVQALIIALALVAAHWCWRLVEEPARQWSRRYAASL